MGVLKGWQNSFEHFPVKLDDRDGTFQQSGTEH